jgi:cell division protein FtsB
MINRSYNLSAQSRRQINKPFWYRFLVSQRFLAIVFLVILIAIAFPLARSISQKKLIEKEIADMKAENEAYANKSKDLLEVVDYLQSDASLEEQARLNLGLKKSNESVVVVDRQNVKTISSSTTEAEDRTTNWLKWINYFFK